MTMKYIIDGEIEQHIRMHINEGFSFPEKIKIVKAELFSFKPGKREKVWKDGTGRVQRTWCFQPWLRIFDEDGNIGEGHASPEVWKTFLPLMLEAEEPMTNLEFRRLFYWKVRSQERYYGAMCQIELLLFDLIANKRNVPMHRLLGAQRDWCDCYKGGGSVLRTDEELVEELLEFKKQGYKATKFKIGIRDIERDLRRLKLVREALGPEFKIAVDANQAWDAETAMTFIREAHQYNVEWFEEPIEAHNSMDEIKKLVKMMKEEDVYIPLAYGESIDTLAMFDCYIRAGVEVIQPKPFTYTITEALKIADYARAKGCRITSGQGYLPGCVFGTLLKEGELIEFHKPNSDYVEDYYCRKGELRDGKIWLPLEAGSPIKADLMRLAQDGYLKDVQYFVR